LRDFNLADGANENSLSYEIFQKPSPPKRDINSFLQVRHCATFTGPESNLMLEITFWVKTMNNNVSDTSNK